MNDVGVEKTLEDEPGIPELKELYYDDLFLIQNEMDIKNFLYN